MTAAGLLTVSRVGNQKHYQANRAAPIFDELEAIVVKTMPPQSTRSAAARIPQVLRETRARSDHADATTTAKKHITISPG